LKEKEAVAPRVGIRHADHVASSIREKLALTSLTSGGRSVGIVRLQTDATELLLLLLLFYPISFSTERQ
jgi:hypothetical protein